MTALDTLPKARQARAAVAAACVPTSAKCKAMGGWWDDLEASTLASHDRRRTIADCLAQIAPLCGSCPAAQACRQWAGLEGYTGYAAGSYLYNGRTHTTLPDSVGPAA